MKFRDERRRHEHWKATVTYDNGESFARDRKRLGKGGTRRDAQGNRLASATFNDIIWRLRNELQRLGADGVVISTNQPVRNDGMPYAQDRIISDPGVAVYFKRKGRQLCMPCDRYELLADNLRAVALSIEAMRTLERHGGAQMMDRAFTGFAQLPGQVAHVKPRRPWREVFGLGEAAPATKELVEAMFRAFSKTRHPDMGGTDDDFRELSDAREDALKELGGK